MILRDELIFLLGILKGAKIDIDQYDIPNVFEIINEAMPKKDGDLKNE